VRSKVRGQGHGETTCGKHFGGIFDVYLECMEYLNETCHPSSGPHDTGDFIKIIVEMSLLR